MNNTPRLRSAYPVTPREDERSGSNVDASAGSVNSDQPVVPLSILDAPSQRFYVAAVYIGITAWRLYDYYRLVSDQTDSLWLFMKWASIDGVFLYGLPTLKVPWLEWSSTTMTVLFLLHACLNAVLMFRIPVWIFPLIEAVGYLTGIQIPLEAWLIALTKVPYDRELAVSERRVKPASILRNASLILGKQIIHILPEGSAVLNPNFLPFCIDSSKSSVELPLRINQTTPILIELLRIDLDTNQNETITISKKEIKRLKRQAETEHGKKDPSSPRTLKVTVKHTGLYRLQKLVDESNLEVQRRMSDTLVVRCPSASVKPVSQNKCLGQLSNFFLQVDATPPFRIKYSRTINREDQSNVYLTIHPETLDSPLAKQRTPGTLVKLDSVQRADVSWASNQHIEIPINETLGVSGGWRYSIDEVQDACGNSVNYTRALDSQERIDPRLEQTFIVRDPPKIALAGYNLETPLKVARGFSATLPIQFASTSTHDTGTDQYHITYSYTPESQLSNLGVNALVYTDKFLMSRRVSGPRISEPGLYTLNSVSTDYCSGDILEPSSCILVNPPEPDLTITSEIIPDKCAGHSIGLLLDLDLLGTPPFQVSYNIQRYGGSLESKVVKIDHMRTQLELKPTEAGHYTYEFVDMDDAVYSMRSLHDKNLKFEQDVRPPASARFTETNPNRFACIQEPVSFNIVLYGEEPWTLEYETVHGNKRQRHKIENIDSHLYTLYTENLKEGGKHLLNLASVTDKSGCKVFLQQEARIEVRNHRPEAAFRQIQGKRTVQALEGKEISLPIRLTGDAPWKITYNHYPAEDATPSIHSAQLKYQNDEIRVKLPGVYELRDIHDKTCPGSVDGAADRFSVSWLPRPSLQIAESSSVELIAHKLVKKAVCEGDQDAMELSLVGSPPFNIRYKVHLKPDRGTAAVGRRKDTAGLNTASVRMETSVAGLYEYEFSELDDQLYEYDKRKYKPLSVEQRVNNRPTATFVNPGKTYSFCFRNEEEARDEVIPIKVVGAAPFSLEIGIRRHATAKPEIVNVPHIGTHDYSLHVPHRLLSLGKHGVTIRKVQDANGCQRVTEFDGPVVHVEVVDVPSISTNEATTDYCVGERISYTLSGTPPFNVFYTFDGAERKATVPTTNFRRLAEKPGMFTIKGVSDRASTDACKAHVSITKHIHELPSVRISKGRTAEVDIHEGGEAEILFEFGGTPPFHFTYTRSTNAVKGKKSVVLETKNEVSHEHALSIKASEEGTYEVVAIRDRFCGFTSQRSEVRSKQQLLTFK
ncbi:hypothetical protein MMC34_003089 [Xylographa carneopallida]|nr:hypothetical protein [Xylographa carneopallida]